VKGLAVTKKTHRDKSPEPVNESQAEQAYWNCLAAGIEDLEDNDLVAELLQHYGVRTNLIVYLRVDHFFLNLASKNLKL
jgi:hypothetical protein